MPKHSGKTVLLALPKNQFEESELFGILQPLKELGFRVVTLSKNGQTATGSEKNKFTPDGMLIDWNKQEGILEKYNIVVVIGGKGAPKSLWTDEILPQILTDHFRAGSIICGIGLGVAPIARASLLPGETAGPEHEFLIQELEQYAVSLAPEPVLRHGPIITARDGSYAGELISTLLQALEEKEQT